MTAEGGEIPRYPPFTEGMPAVDTKAILRTQEDLIRQIRQEVKLPPQEIDRLVMPAIESYAGFVHLLPASEAHHHRGAGGLFRHGLEVAFWTIRIFRGYVVDTDQPPGRRKDLEKRWRYAAFLIGLLHDVGKPVTDMRVVDASGDRTWRPHRESLGSWLAEQGIERYYLRWIPDRYRSHEYVGASVLHHLLPQPGADFLHEAGPPLEGVIYRYLTRSASGRKERPLKEAVERAEAISIRRDLEGQQVALGDARAAVPVARYLIDAMRRLINEGHWRPNEGDPPRVWVLDESSIGIDWPEGIREVARLLQADEVQGLPSDPLSIAEILQDHGLAGLRSETDTEDHPEQLIETVAPAPLQHEGEEQRQVRVLRVNRLAIGGLDEYPEVALEPLRDPRSESDTAEASEPEEATTTEETEEGAADTADASTTGAAEDAADEAVAGAPPEKPLQISGSSKSASDDEKGQDPTPSPATAAGTQGEEKPPVPEVARPLAEAIRAAGWREGMHWAVFVDQLPGAEVEGTRPIQVVDPYTEYLEKDPHRPVTVLHRREGCEWPYVRLNGLLSRRISDWLAKIGHDQSQSAPKESSKGSKKSSKGSKSGKRAAASNNDANPQSSQAPPSDSDSSDSQEQQGQEAKSRQISGSSSAQGSEHRRGQQEREDRIQGFLAWLATQAQTLDALDGESEPIAVWSQGQLWVSTQSAVRLYCKRTKQAPTTIQAALLNTGTFRRVPNSQLPEAVIQALGERAFVSEVTTPLPSAEAL